MFGLKLDTANKFYAMRETDVAEKFGLYKSQVDAINAENRRAMQAEFGLYKSQIDADFGLYKNQRDQYDALQAKYSDLDKKVAVMEALTPYKEKLMMAYVNEKCCRKIDGQLVLPSTPVVTGTAAMAVIAPLLPLPLQERNRAVRKSVKKTKKK